jgi:5-methylcytosine-specific restriction enzyme B
MALPETLTREHVEQAIAQLDAGAPHSFGASTDYDLVFNGKAYPPKAVAGLAAALATGTVFGPSDFSGGEAPGQANTVLRSLGFTVDRRNVNAPTTQNRVPPRSPALHPKLWEEWTDRRTQLMERGELRSPDALEGYYATFRRRFGPDVLRELDGEPLLSLMHETTKDGLVYWLEFKDDDEFPAIFGSIGGGSALKFGLYRRRETGAWTTGSSSAQRELSTAEAVQMARTHRDQLIAASDTLAAFSPDGDDAAYIDLQAELARVAPAIQDSSWGHKYLSLLYPEKVDDFHASTYQRFNLVKALQQPPEAQGRYVCAARFIALRGLLDWPMNHLMTVFSRRNGPPHRYWRIGTRDDQRSYWETMRDQSVVAVGWREIGNLSAALEGKEFKEAVRELLRTHYPANPQSIGRQAQQIAQFCQTLQARDYVVASDGATVLGIGRVTGPYSYEPSEGFPHRRSVEWLDIGQWQLPTTEGLQTTVHECRATQTTWSPLRSAC